MTNIAAVFKTEIVRLARKTTKADLAALRSANAAQRKQIAALRSQIIELQRSVSQLQKARPAIKVDAATENDSSKGGRFSAKGLKSHRAKLGLSAKNYGRLVGASELSVYNWESGTRPRRAQVEALLAIRGLGKRAAQEKLRELDAS